MKNFYLIERYFGDVSNVAVPIGITSSRKRGYEKLKSLNCRGIITKLQTNQFFNPGIGIAEHWHVERHHAIGKGG
jgi:hypothetical protein